MPDISMCLNDRCVKRKECYRYMAVPSTYIQSFNPYSPDNNTEEEFNCENLYPIGDRIIVNDKK